MQTSHQLSIFNLLILSMNHYDIETGMIIAFLLPFAKIDYSYRYSLLLLSVILCDCGKALKKISPKTSKAEARILW